MKKQMEVVWSDGRITVREYEDTSRSGCATNAQQAFDLLRTECACRYTPRAAKPVSSREI